MARHAGDCATLAIVRGTRMLVIAAAAIVAAVLGLLLLFRFVDPPGSALMVLRRLDGQPIAQRWARLEAMSPHLMRAVVVAEDGRFCSHNGVDFQELEDALDRADRTGDDVRGASTITMQVAKNLFLWPGRSYLRKGLEIGAAFAMEAVWPKRRILEVYLNIAEWGPGVFGAEAAARHHFGKPAARLSPRESALLAAALPNPIERVAGRPGPGTQRLAGLIERRAQGSGPRLSCLGQRKRLVE